MTAFWSDRFLGSKFTKEHANGVVTHGATEPVLTVLDVRNFDVRDLFLIGFNDHCGSIMVETRERAESIKEALEPAYAVTIEQPEGRPYWEAKFDRQMMDGTTPSWFVRNITMKDGRKVMEDGKWTC